MHDQVVKIVGGLGGSREVDVETRGSKNTLAIEVLDASGNQVTNFGGTGGDASAANQTSGNQKTQIVDGDGQVAGVTNNKLDVNAALDTTGLATDALQILGNTALDSIKTNTDTLVTGGAGGYIRQDSTGTIAKETGGNLATTATNTTNIYKSINGAGAPTVDSYTSAAIDEVTGANQSLIAAPGANKQLYIYGYSFSVDTAGTTVELQDEDDVVKVSYAEGFAQYGGVARNPSGNFAMPLFKVATNKALEADVVGGAMSGDIQYAIISI